MEKSDLVKCAQLDMLVELKRICEKHELHYILIGGTLLGAIRHDGFIPWDDDIDVGLLRSDYEKLVTVCEQELSSEYELIDWWNDPGSPIPFLKMKIKGTHFLENLSKNAKKNDGIFIDIFPIDVCPNSKMVARIEWAKCYLIKKILLLRCGYDLKEGKSIFKKCAYDFLYLCSTVKSITKWKKIFYRIATKYNEIESENFVCYCGAYSMSKEVKPKFVFTTYATHMFELEEFCIPTHYDTYLTGHYGDYMKLPPENERKSPHDIIAVDLGSYLVKSKLKKVGGYNFEHENS